MPNAFTPMTIVGGTGGSPFIFDGRFNGATVQRLSVAVGECQVKGIKLWLTDGRKEKFGILGDSTQEFKFEAGEFVSRLSLWDNGDGTRLGAIAFKTSHNRNFFAKMTDRALRDRHEVEVGSGIFLGVQGRSGSEIDAMGFLFLNPIQSTVIQNVNYTTIQQVLPVVKTEVVKNDEFTNTTGIMQTFTFECSVNFTERASWFIPNKIESTYAPTVNAGIPIVTKADTGFVFAVAFERACALENVEERTEPLVMPVEVRPGKTVAFAATLQYVDVELPYTALLRVTCSNGALFDVGLSGQFKGVIYGSLTGTATESYGGAWPAPH